MFGVAQVICGIFCVTYGGSPGLIVGGGAVLTGLNCIFSSLNNGWVDHERAMIDLKTWETNVKKAAEAK